MADEKWYPSAESGGQVVGRFKHMDMLNVPESIEADEKRYRKIIVLEHKAIASVDVSTTPVKPHNERELRTRFPQAWAAFQGAEPEIPGTPIKNLTFLSEDQIMTLKINGVYVIEQLAQLSDARCQSLGFGWRTTRTRAQTFLKEQTERIAREDRVERKKAEEAA